MTEAPTVMTVAESMFNAPFIGTVIVATAVGWTSERDDLPMPASLAFIAAPLVLDAQCRRTLPRDMRTHLTEWVNRNPGARAQFPARAAQTVHVVRAGLRWALRADVLRFEGGGIRATRSVRTGSAARRAVDAAAETAGVQISDPDALDIMRAARFVGRWFTKNENASTTFALLGVRP